MEIIVAIITGVCSILAVIMTTASSNKKIEHQLDKSQAIMDTKLEALTAEVRACNEASRRVPVIEEQIKVINHRLEDLEHERKDH